MTAKLKEPSKYDPITIHSGCSKMERICSGIGNYSSANIEGDLFHA
jgi:hypothetical protein